MKHEDDGDTNCNWRTWNDPQNLNEKSWRSWNRRTNYSITEVGQNTEKSP